MKHAATGIIFFALVLCGGRTEAQQRIGVHAAGFIESYKFDEGLEFERLTQFTIPLGFDVRLGRWGDFAVSSSWAYTRLKPANSTAEDEETRGLTDTDFRLSLNLVPSRLMLILGGVVPTGIETVDPRELAVLGAISSDIIGLISNELGTGGRVAMGFVGAFPLGRYALGLGATVDNSFAYRPVSDTTAQLKPGNQFRVRMGFEGPLGPRSYLRFAGVYAVRSKDKVDGSPVNSIGNRITGYLSVNQGIGSSALIFYGFDVYRADPQLEPTAVGSAVLPAGNLLAVGFRWDVPLARVWSITPRAEFRNSHLVPFEDPDSPMKLAGRSLRAGFDFGRRLGRSFSLVLQGDGLTGFVVQEGSRIDVVGFRVGLHGQLTW
ncbi:MAG: hypothetical protein AMS18_02600 [Gemmatimonas sp. SG8_17]|nr:MAG: hypothetical protein AMS18_02600 [Gemmatimonas sp. SG8_17]